jgi:hypothetical protein
VNRLIGALFAVGSACFVIAPFPGFLQLVGAGADGAVFFAGSIFFTSAAFLQWRQSPRDPAGIVQLAGTLFFNRSTFNALQEGLSTEATDHLVWRPDALGSICFLVASALAWWALRDRGRDREWWIGALNMLGSILFGLSAIAAYVVPETGDVIDLAMVNWATASGAACFLAGGVMLRRVADPAPASASTCTPP